MSTPEELARQAEAVARVRIARIKRDKVTAEAAAALRQEIVAAWSTGAAVRDIALAADMTASRCYQIINEER